MLSLNRLATTARAQRPSAVQSNFTIKESSMSWGTPSLASGYVWNVISPSGTFTVNDAGVTHSAGTFILPAGNYVVCMNYSFNATLGNNAGLSLQTGTSQSPSTNYSLLDAWEYGGVHQAVGLVIGCAFTASTGVRSWGTSGNASQLAAGTWRIYKLERPGEPSGNQARASVSTNFSIATGWQTLKFSTRTLSSISGMTFNATTGDFSIPAGMYLITLYVYHGNPITGCGFQTTSSASTPSSLTNPTELDVWQYTPNTGSAQTTNVSFWYNFNVPSSFRVFYYSGSNTTISTANLVVTRY